jgi:hypothetical protein
VFKSPQMTPLHPSGGKDKAKIDIETEYHWYLYLGTEPLATPSLSHIERVCVMEADVQYMYARNGSTSHDKSVKKEKRSSPVSKWQL